MMCPLESGVIDKSWTSGESSINLGRFWSPKYLNDKICVKAILVALA
jgi:hypothetical protein